MRRGTPKPPRVIAVLRVGGLVFSAYWEESPALVDLQIYTGRREQSFDILASEIQAAMAQYNVSGTLFV